MSGGSDSEGSSFERIDSDGGLDSSMEFVEKFIESQASESPRTSTPSEKPGAQKTEAESWRAPSFQNDQAKFLDLMKEAMILEKTLFGKAKDYEPFLESIVQEKMKNMKLEVHPATEHRQDLRDGRSQNTSTFRFVNAPDFQPYVDKYADLVAEFRSKQMAGVHERKNVPEESLFEHVDSMELYEKVVKASESPAPAPSEGTVTKKVQFTECASMKRTEVKGEGASEKKKPIVETKEEDWRREVSEELRTQRIVEIAEALFPGRPLKAAISESRKVEQELFERANNLEHYCNLCSMLACSSVPTRKPMKVEDWRQKINRRESLMELATVILVDTDPSCLADVELCFLMAYVKKKLPSFAERIEMMKKEKPEKLREELLGSESEFPSSIEQHQKLQELGERVEKLESDMREAEQELKNRAKERETSAPSICEKPPLPSEAPASGPEDPDSRPILQEINGVWKLVARENTNYNALYGLLIDFKIPLGMFSSYNVMNDRIVLANFNRSKEFEALQNARITSKDACPIDDIHYYVEHNQLICINKKQGSRHVRRIVDGKLRVEVHQNEIGSFTNVLERTTENFEHKVSGTFVSPLFSQNPKNWMIPVLLLILFYCVLSLCKSFNELASLFTSGRS